MAHRAQKNRLRHGYNTKMEGSGEKAEYKTNRPSHVKGDGYRNVEVTQAQPKIGRINDDNGMREWKPRHQGRP